MSISVSHCACRQDWHATFLSLLPQIRDYAIPAFRHANGADREEFVQESIVHAFLIFVRLMQRGKTECVYATTIARFAIGKARQGRTVGTRRNSRDVTSKYAQRRRNFVVGQLCQCDSNQPRWLEAVVEDHRTPVVDQVWFRIDFPTWLSRLPARKRRIAQCLADGHSTNAAARRFRLSAARISQIRVELRESWEGFHGEPDTAAKRHLEEGPSNRPQRRPGPGARIAASLWFRSDDSSLRVVKPSACFREPRARLGVD